jgi:2-polyprenyl-3-methyl-5-hydroxy-6-metoxy-1,4-benzoquinol methylase
MTPACNICGRSAESPIERADVVCNVRAFLSERFPVWRCPHCLSIHGSEPVDLDHYYRQYPFHSDKLDLMAVVSYDNLLRRLRRAGLRKAAKILDYGCGNGRFVRFLHGRGYTGAVGYDAYSAAFCDPAALAGSYDCVVAQDVIEHAGDPRALLAKLGERCRPGGVLAIGTPNAEAVDLSRADDFRHTLHQPYHLHILSKRALLEVAHGLGFTLLRYYKRQYSNTPWPALNQAFALYYARCFDDTIDLAFDGPRFSPRLLLPQAIFWACFGYFFSVETDVMAVFRVQAARAA